MSASEDVQFILHAVKQIEERVKTLGAQQEARLKVLEEKEKHWQETKKKMKQTAEAAKSQIVLDVGGTKFTTTKETLLKFKNTYFSNMIKCGSVSEDGVYFIDRNPKLFEVVLDYLRCGVLNDAIGKSEIEKEFAFYSINLPEDYIFEAGKQAVVKDFYAVNKGTLLHQGKHTWTVKIENIGAPTDIGVVAPTHTASGNNQVKTIWALRNNGCVPLVSPSTKVFDGFKNGDTVRLDLDLDKKSLQFTVNSKKIDFSHADVVAPVHIAMCAGAGAKASIV